MLRLNRLQAHLRGLGRVVLGYSGGVDSALLAVVARYTLGPERMLAVIGRSESYPEVQHRQAVDLARRFAIPLLEVPTHEMSDPEYLANPVDRCYFCKRELWTRLASVADRLGFDTVIDGNNADDLREHRPGVRAALERRVRSPLAELGWTKPMIREAARALDLPLWDAPAAPCLSSRIAYGLSITPRRLEQVERGETLLRALGVRGDLRVRHLDARAKIEVSPGEMPLLTREWATIEREFLALGFTGVELDPRGYRRGAMLADLPVLSG